MAKKLKEFEITLKVRVNVQNEFHASGIAEGLVEHVLDTFNDDESLTDAWVVNVVPQD